MPDYNHKYVGRKIIYQGGHPNDREEGVVSSVNAHYVFVRFGNNAHGAACAPASLTFLGGGKPDLTIDPPAIETTPDQQRK